jgi:O-antigen ligase
VAERFHSVPDRGRAWTHVAVAGVVVASALSAFVSLQIAQLLLSGAILVLAFARIWWFVVPALLTRASLDVVQGGTPAEPVVGVAALLGAGLLGVSAVFLVVQWRAGALRQPELTTRCFGLLSLVAIVGAFAAENPAFSLGVAGRIVLVTMVLALVEQLVAERPERWSWIAATVIGSAVIPVVVGLGQIGNREEVARIVGTFINANSFATYLTVVLALAVALRPLMPAAIRVASGLVLMGGGVALVFTLSRGAGFGLVVALAIIGVLQQPRLLPLVAVAVVAVFAWVPSVGDRLEDLEQTSEDVSAFGVDPNSLAFRQRYWVGLLSLYNESPIIGHGIGMSEDYLAIERLRETQRYEPHNIYVQALVEMGAAGAAALALVVVCTASDLRRALRLAPRGPTRAMAVAASAIGVSLLVQGYSDNVLTSGVVMTYWASVMGAVLGLAHGRKAASKRRLVGFVPADLWAELDRIEAESIMAGPAQAGPATPPR